MSASGVTKWWPRIVYFIVYLFMNLGAFYVVMLVANKTGREDIEEYKGLAARAPFVSAALAIFLISLTGLPPPARVMKLPCSVYETTALSP